MVRDLEEASAEAGVADLGCDGPAGGEGGGEGGAKVD